jgi:hypothetical protein
MSKDHFMEPALSVWVGFDPREACAFAVCKHSIQRCMTQPIPVKGIVLSQMRERGLYYRPTEVRSNGQLWDTISEAPMSTEFAISRFLTPHLARSGWAIFMDCDVLARTSLARLFEQRKDKYAVMVVKHDHDPDYSVKMDGQAQTRYSRKNWSSVMLFNVDHPANKALDLINEAAGRDLHAFCWLEDHQIGALDPSWNYLVGHTKLPEGKAPGLVHYTDGIPSMRGYEECEFADEFRAELEAWACGLV